jgi:flagellar protein FliO/FliZ
MDISPMQVILFLLGFGSILFLAYVTTRYVAGKSNRAMKGKHISIVETISLGLDKRIHLVKAGGQYILISTTSKRIDFLTSIDLGTEVLQDDENETNKNKFDFKSIFDKYVNTYKSNRNNLEQYNKNEASIGISDERNFKTNLGRLKEIIKKTDKQAEKDGVDNTNEE